ncbi:MAG: hypothetical protein AB7T31_07485 [Gemmatimonadales bacterium]
MMRSARRLFAPALALAGVAAASAHLSAQVPTTVTVENTRNVPVVVYLERGFYDARLGTVPPLRTSVLSLPITLEDGDAVQFIVHPEGGIDLATPLGLHATQGTPLEIFVPTNNAGFVPPQPPPMIPYAGGEGAGVATVTVENQSRRPAVVFVERGEFDTRIGTVGAGLTETLPLPGWLTRREQQADIFVHVEGGADLASQQFELAPNAHLFVRVPE